MDPWNSLGSGDMLEGAQMAVQAAHLSEPDASAAFEA
jgi:hypothetical protein